MPRAAIPSWTCCGSAGTIGGHRSSPARVAGAASCAADWCFLIMAAMVAVVDAVDMPGEYRGNAAEGLSGLWPGAPPDACKANAIDVGWCKWAA